MYKALKDKDKEGRIKGGRQGWLEQERVSGGWKWRQPYLNNNKKIKMHVNMSKNKEKNEI